MVTLLPSLGRQGICVVLRPYQQRALRPRARGGAGRAFLPSNRGPAALGGAAWRLPQPRPSPPWCPRSALLGRCLPRGDLAPADWGTAGLGTTPVPAPGAAFPPGCIWLALWSRMGRRDRRDSGRARDGWGRLSFGAPGAVRVPRGGETGAPAPSSASPRAFSKNELSFWFLFPLQSLAWDGGQATGPAHSH